jgi:hypothetical protein
MQMADRRLQQGIYGGSLVVLKEEGLFDKEALESGLLNRR